MKSRVLRGAMRLFGVLGLDGDRQLVVTRYCLRGFFDAYLNGGVGSVSSLDLSSSQYPELQGF